MKNMSCKQKNITVKVMNPLTKEEAKEKVKNIEKTIKLIYGNRNGSEKSV